MALFNKKNKKTEIDIKEHIYLDNITATENSIIIKNGWVVNEVPFNMIDSWGINYGLKSFNNKDIYKGQAYPGGLERFFSGEYDVKVIPPIGIWIKTKEDKYIIYPLTITKMEKGRKLILAEQIFTNLDEVIIKAIQPSQE